MVKKFTIKNKIIFITLSVTMLSLGIWLIVVIYNNIKGFKRDMVENTLMNTKLIGEYCVAPITFDDKASAEGILVKLQNIPSVENGKLYDIQGNLFAEYNKLNSTFTPPSFSEGSFSKFEEDYLHVYQPIIFQEKSYGHIYIRASTAVLTEKINKYLLNMLVVFVATILIAYLLANYLQRIISSPILHLASVTEHISKEMDYSVRIQKKGNDEISLLYDGFNNMLEQIHNRELERDKAEESLRFSQFVIDKASDQIWYLDKEGNILYANKSAIDRIGFSIEELQKKKVSSINPLYQTDTTHWEMLWERLRKNESNVYETSHISKDGDIYPVEVSPTYIQYQGREINCSFVRDITERKKTDATLREINKSLEEMVYITSHDLQVPLVSMEGYASELLETYKDKLDDEGIYCLSRLKTNAQRMHKLVLSLLDISRLNTRKYPHELFEPLDIVNNIINDLALVIEKAQAKIEILEMPPIVGDRQRIEIVFRNLISNAINYEGKNIKVGFNDINKAYFVQDDGMGIPVDQLEKIFSPGERLKMNKADGVGMGLTFCEKVIKQHNGKMWAYSEGLKKGAIFFFKLNIENQ